MSPSESAALEPLPPFDATQESTAPAESIWDEYDRQLEEEQIGRWAAAYAEHRLAEVLRARPGAEGEYLSSHNGDAVAHWNEEPGRTQEEVLELFQEASDGLTTDLAASSAPEQSHVIALDILQDARAIISYGWQQGTMFSDRDGYTFRSFDAAAQALAEEAGA